MIVRLIGSGAAGNKAAITAVENQIMPISHTMLINSTLKDIPAEYQNKDGANVKQFIGAYGGCGKERNISYELCKDTLMKDTLQLKDFLNVGDDNEAELVIIVASTEGGTGSGSVPLIADYIRHVLGIAVHVFAITGFEDDVRGMRNTVDFFKEMKADYTVECIKNSKFLSDCHGNKIKAEKEANKEFCKKISVLMGLQIRDSEHNIDPTDLLKLSTEEGYMIIESCIFTEKIKNAEQFERTLVDTLDKSKALDIDDPAMTKLGVIINIKEDNTDHISYENILTDRFGVPYERYVHIQHEEQTMPEFIAFIAAGMKMPNNEVESIYKNYTDAAARVDRNADPFFSTIVDKTIDPNDDKFNLKPKKDSTIDESDFFKKKPGFNNTKTRMVSAEVEGVTDEY